MPDAPRFAHEVRPGCSRSRSTTVRLLGRNLPAGGGGYFRLLPYALSRWSLRRVNAVDRQAGDLLLPSVGDRPRPAARRRASAPKTRFRHYVNLDRMEPRLQRLLARLPLGPDGPRLPRWRAMTCARPRTDARTAPRPRPSRRRRSTPRDARALGRLRRALPRGDVLPPRRLARDHRATSSATRRTSCYAERDGRDRRRAAARARSRACCSATRWSRCRSPSTAASRPTTPTRATR